VEERDVEAYECCLWELKVAGGAFLEVLFSSCINCLSSFIYLALSSTLGYSPPSLDLRSLLLIIRSIFPSANIPFPISFL
jgi:hypothetical protein